MSNDNSKPYRRAGGDDALQAATVLAIQFGRWCDSTEAGKAPPEPDEATQVKSADQVADAVGRIAGHLGLRTTAQRRALVDLLCGIANMIGDQGAELEGVLHPLLHPGAGPRHAMVVRLRVADDHEAAAVACPECDAVGGHRPGCAASVKH